MEEIQRVVTESSRREARVHVEPSKHASVRCYLRTWLFSFGPFLHSPRLRLSALR